MPADDAPTAAYPDGWEDLTEGLLIPAIIDELPINWNWRNESVKVPPPDPTAPFTVQATARGWAVTPPPEPPTSPTPAPGPGTAPGTGTGASHTTPPGSPGLVAHWLGESASSLRSAANCLEHAVSLAGLLAPTGTSSSCAPGPCRPGRPADGAASEPRPGPCASGGPPGGGDGGAGSQSTRRTWDGQPLPAAGIVARVADAARRLTVLLAADQSGLTSWNHAVAQARDDLDHWCRVFCHPAGR